VPCVDGAAVSYWLSDTYISLCVVEYCTYSTPL
jgi:hypothetical protein